MNSVAISLLALGVVLGGVKASKTEPAPDSDSDFLEGVRIDPPAETPAAARIASDDEIPATSPSEQGTDTIVDLDNVEIDSWSNDEPFRELVTREAYVQSSFGNARAAARIASDDEIPATLPAEQGTDTIVDRDDVDIDPNIDDGRNNVEGAPAPPADDEPSPEGLDLIGQEPDGPLSAIEDGEDPTAGTTDDDNSLAAWLDGLRISLQHEASYKFAPPERVVNNRSSVRLEYSKPLTSNLYLRLDTKLNLHWSNDHRAEARGEDLFRELITREAYVQSSFGNTSLRLGYQIVPWGVSEGGAITDEVSPRNSSEFFFISLEESRIAQPMLLMDNFGDASQWTAFLIPRPGYNKYPDRRSEYDIPGAFERNAPDDDWDNAGTYEFGGRWKRTFGKSEISLMAARLIENDYLVRQQRFGMYGLTANIPIDNLLLRAEVALKQPRAFFARSADSSEPRVVESDQLDSSFGFDYSPGGRALTYSAEVVWRRLLDWRNDIVGREQDDFSLVASVRNRFFNDDLTLSWLTIYNKPYTSFQHKFLSSYLIDDNSTVYFELFFPDERDERSGTFPYRDQKQFVIRYQYQF